MHMGTRPSSRCALALAMLLCGVQVWGQESLPVPGPLDSAPRQVPDPGPVVACVRIPAELITKDASQSFQTLTPVNRVILGTHSRGQALCDGQVECRLREQKLGAVFECFITGTVRSSTCGVNGPALIDSTTLSCYEGSKLIVFDGRQLVTQPATLRAKTQIQIKGVDNSSPGLRGRIVRRVASRRAEESLGEAEAITNQLTVRELQEQIDREFEQRIRAANKKMKRWLSILDRFSTSEYALSIQSHPQFIDILLQRRQTPDSLAGEISDLPDFPLGQSVILWIPLPKIALGRTSGWETVTLADVADWLPVWLAASLIQKRAQIDEFTPRVDLLRHESWMGFEFDRNR